MHIEKYTNILYSSLCTMPLYSSTKTVKTKIGVETMNHPQHPIRVHSWKKFLETHHYIEQTNTCHPTFTLFLLDQNKFTIYPHTQPVYYT